MKTNEMNKIELNLDEMEQVSGGAKIVVAVTMFQKALKNLLRKLID